MLASAWIVLADATASAGAAATMAGGGTGGGVQDHWWDVSKWDSTTWITAGLGTLVVLMIVTWGAVRFWLVVTRPPKIKDVHTPTLDRMNAAALEHMSDGQDAEEDVNPPADLLAVVPEEEKTGTSAGPGKAPSGDGAGDAPEGQTTAKPT